MYFFDNRTKQIKLNETQLDLVSHMAELEINEVANHNKNIASRIESLK